ncbi:SLAIN motif-containing protein-like isoform X1 [Acipenser ruthenus]|uniref:SLAIN motif-containing protein-like isoform X1 n=1 Tax=Acipenser ruthenus TaxID=7906 RepID=UPI00145BCD80|nr:SLAIN motif-containing protein-like isoform X1 [Acipenser ruthenus]XP_033906262.1 SLAIN motif-containing protein-like isoform X1 [Acipenser ruthenus]XP_058857065.1 SLAIN motif-containing protein-like isoform X1 [Acipenser ruthenus]
MVVPENATEIQPLGHSAATELGGGPGPGFEADQNQSVPELEEVRKLQDLVRRLEIQNQQLRNRGGKSMGANSNLTAAGNINDRTMGDVTLTEGVANKTVPLRPDGNINLSNIVTNLDVHLHDSNSSVDKLTNLEHVNGLEVDQCDNVNNYLNLPRSNSEVSYDKDSSTTDLTNCEGDPGAEEKLDQSALDEVEVLNLEDGDEDEEDSWLYVSPMKKLLAEQRPESPLKWCRQVLDHPSQETEAACRTLMGRLDQTTRWKNIYSSPSQCASSSTSEVGCASNALNSPGYLKSTNKSLLTCGSSGYMSMHSALSSQSSVDSEQSTSDDSISMGYKLQDLTDVQIMARLQEESLRQDYASSSASVSRRSSSASLHSLRRGTYSDQEFDTYSLEDEEEDYSLSYRSNYRYSPSPLSSPRCQSPSAMAEYSRATAPHARPPRRSLQGPVPELVKSAKNEDDMRRSMPNLARTSLRSLEAVRNSRSVESNLQGPGSRISRLQHTSTGLPSSKLRGPSTSSQSPLSVRAPVKAVGYAGSMGASRQPLKAAAGLGGPSGVSCRVQSPTCSSSGSTGGVSSTSRNTGVGGKQTPGRTHTSLGGPTGSPRGRLPQPSRRSLGLTKTCSPVRDESWKDGCY